MSYIYIPVELIKSKHHLVGNQNWNKSLTSVLEIEGLLVVGVILHCSYSLWIDVLVTFFLFGELFDIQKIVWHAKFLVWS